MSASHVIRPRSSSGVGESQDEKAPRDQVLQFTGGVFGEYAVAQEDKHAETDAQDVLSEFERVGVVCHLACARFLLGCRCLVSRCDVRCLLLRQCLACRAWPRKSNLSRPVSVCAP